MTLEEKKEQVKNFRPIDDTFFEVLADDIGVCQEMLRIILEDEKLIVKDVIVQSSERNLYGRSVRLDALCILGNRKKCNVEVQRSNKDHHLKRVRFNASVITVRDSQTDDKFEETIDLIVVYISEFDIFKPWQGDLSCGQRDSGNTGKSGRRIGTCIRQYRSKRRNNHFRIHGLFSAKGSRQCKISEINQPCALSET